MATESAPWQIKSMPIGTREKAVRYAKMRGETKWPTEEWLNGNSAPPVSTMR